MKSHLKIRLKVPASVQEITISALIDMGFEGFQEEDGQILDAWILSDRFTDEVRQSLMDWIDTQPDACRILEEESVDERNWNEEWESTIRPMQVGSFYIHPTWGDISPPSHAIPLAIDPKMAFGTGYHETTRLMLRLIPEVIRKGDRVLDMGTGTGILAIAALKTGADKAVGIDTDPWCYDNAIENAEINGLADKLEIRIGSTDKLKSDETFDLILANINRNILLDLGDALVKKLAPGGSLLLSGIMDGDEDAIFAHRAYGVLKCRTRLLENDWMGLVLSRNEDAV